MKHNFTSLYDMRHFAEDKLDHPGDRLKFFGWTETFGSTSGPCGGYGG
jgi:hypothetical protein